MASKAGKAKTAGRRGLKLFDGKVHGASILSGLVDRYNGIRIETKSVDPSTTTADFKQQLVDSLAVYR